MAENEDGAASPVLAVKARLESAVKDQHQKIAGYRDLTQAEVDLMNELKAKEAEVGELYQRVAALAREDGDAAAGRWASLGRTDCETGFMYLIKAVARPSNGLGRA